MNSRIITTKTKRAIPWPLFFSLSRHIIKAKLKNNRQIPYVLMLEPTFRCNLSCEGCGRIREYQNNLDRRLNLDECIDAVEQTEAPIVSITGGEPLLHPEIHLIVQQIIKRKRTVNLCTNGMLLSRELKKFTPDPHLYFVFHLDGLAETHNNLAGKKNVFETAIAAISEAKQKGYQVLTNTTVYKNTNMEEINNLFVFLRQLAINGIMISPAFGYKEVDSEVFLKKHEFVKKFQELYRNRFWIPFFHTPYYLDFLAGKKELICTPWSTPTRNPLGWKRPCYLITDGHCGSYKELIEETDWKKYGTGHDVRCKNCMVHSGFEASALEASLHSLPDIWAMIQESILGIKIPNQSHKKPSMKK